MGLDSATEEPPTWTSGRTWQLLLLLAQGRALGLLPVTPMWGWAVHKEDQPSRQAAGLFVLTLRAGGV